MYLKMIFLRNHDQAMRHLQFKFQAVPAGSAGTCHFAEKWMVSMVTHLIGGLLIKYGLLFIKNSVGAFWQKSMVDASQKLVFSTFGKWKIDFLFKEDENSLWRHCLPLQDTHMCTIWDHYHKLFVG